MYYQNTSTNLHSKEQCPQCHFNYIAGYEENNIRRCPSCKYKYNNDNKCSTNTLLNKGLNNTYYNYGCPALMSDGRFITYYNSTNELTECMRKLMDSKVLTHFVILCKKNANEFMNAERKYQENINTCNINTACSEGWYDFSTKMNSDWSGNCFNYQC